MIGSVPRAVLVVVGIYAFVGLVAWFVRLERTGRRHIALAVLALALAGQVTCYVVDSKIPVGVFRPGPLRLPEIIIFAALAARGWVAAIPRRFTPAGVAWLAFGLWYGTAAIAGWLYGNDTSHVLFHGKLLVYVGGGYLLTSGIDPKRLVRLVPATPWLVAFGALATVEVYATFTNGVVPGPIDPARLGPDAASLYIGFALVVLFIEATRPRPSGLVVLAMLPLLVGMFTTGQRATFIHGASTIALVLLVAAGSRTWRRRMVVNPTQVFVGIVVVLMLVGIATFPRVRQDSIDPVAASSVVTNTFGGIGKIQSTKARVYKWEAATELASQHPLFGSGLGVEHESFQPGAGNGFGQFQLGSTFDNIYLDLLVRSGVIGLLLFCLALSLSLRDGWYVWRNHPNSEIAALVLGATLFVAGLALKGAIESVLEKVVLACALGIALGAIAAARAALHTGDTPHSSLPRGAEPQWT